MESSCRRGQSMLNVVDAATLNAHNVPEKFADRL